MCSRRVDTRQDHLYYTIRRGYPFTFNGGRLMKRCVWSFVCAFVLLAGPVRADVWDTAVIPTITPDPTTHRFTAPSNTRSRRKARPRRRCDLYSITAPPRRHGRLIHGITGDTGNGGLSFQWLAADGNTVLASGQFLLGVTCTLCTQSARLNNNAVGAAPVFIRVGNPGCGITCDTDDQYTFRLREDHLLHPEFEQHRIADDDPAAAEHCRLHRQCHGALLEHRGRVPSARQRMRSPRTPCSC